MKIIQKWEKMKQKNPEMIFLFRVGDFYELFGNDAIIAAKNLNLTVTTRNEMPMVGFPHQALEDYLRKLLTQNQRVAIIDEDSK